MLVALLSLVTLLCWVATSVASVKLYKMRKAAKNEAGWHFKPAARRWAWIGNAGYVTGALLVIPFFILEQVALAAAALIGGIVLIFVFVSAAGSAAGQGEGAN